MDNKIQSVSKCEKLPTTTKSKPVKNLIETTKIGDKIYERFD